MITVNRRWSAIAIAVLAFGVAAPARADDTLLLPDLRQAPVGCPGGFGGEPSTCTAWDVCVVQDANAPGGRCTTAGSMKAVRLRFTSSEDNIGEGPLLLFGSRDNTTQKTMQVRQAFQALPSGEIPKSYEAAQRQTATSTYYEPAKSHEHWHLMGFERFELRAPGGGVVATDRKNGFCLGDRYTTPDASGLAHTVHDDDSPQGSLGRFLAKNMCNMRTPDALTVTEGISVGRGDDYRHTVDFQWLDITTVASGTYDVVNTVNSDRTLLESNYDNNSSSIAISVQWPAGAQSAPKVITAPPVVKLLRSCPGRAQCA
ncbi:lysyl oxidase family protein [Umezawaea sp. Da 62-37]|uniref:lysyl oxidase family protein n=1 Tax=Umezawaea sp. Da 62-37 TaxID=3075927 RepID=UPI0028F6D8C5|nr:lysyl oxidase family protein [Umezawaea sp. Da 62-37]WNV83926.1 lysyl oxidase family protein [Umezawaea sp. Da 62-37]